MDYKVAVALAMTSNHAQVLGALSSQLLGVHAKVNQLAGGFNRLKLAIGSALAVTAGTEVFKTMGKMVEHGEKLVHYQTQLRAAGYDNQKIAEATAQAYQTSRDVLSSNIAENLRDIHHLADITGDINEAVHLSSTFAQVKQVLASLKDDKLKKHFAGDELQTYNFARALEVMGVTQKGPEVINDWVQKLTASMIAMRGLVDGTKIYQAVNLSGGAAMNWSQDFVAKKLPFLIQELNAPAAGNALYMMYAGLAQGRITKGGAEGLEKYGLIRGAEDHLTDKAKRFLGVKPGSVKGTDVLQRDPEEWVRSVLLPALQAKGVDTTNANQLQTALGEIARNKNFLRMLQVLGQQQAQMQKEIANYERALKEGGPDHLKTDPSIMKKSFFAQWDNFLTALGSPNVAPAYEVLGKITIALKDMTAAVEKMNPETLRSLGYGIAVLGASLVGAGVAGLLAAIGPAGWLVLGIGALAAALVAFKDKIPAVLNAIRDLMTVGIITALYGIVKAGSAIVDAVKGIAQSFRSAVAALPGEVAGAIASAFAAIGAAIKSAISGMFKSDGKALGNTDPNGIPLPTPNSFRGGEQQRDLMKSINWQPPQKTQAPIYVNSKLDLDGRTLAEAVADKLAQILEFPSSAPYFDGKRAWSPNDMQTTGT
jgi:hypothetical protein